MSNRVLRITDATPLRLVNGTFDLWSGGVPSNWTATGTPTTTQVLSEGTLQSLIGAYALDIENAGSAAVRGYYQEYTDIEEGATCYIQVYVKPITGVLRLYAWDGGGTSNPVYVESTTDTNWQELIVEKVAGANGVRIGLVAYDANSHGVFDLCQVATFSIEFIEGVYDTHFRVTNWDVQVPDYKGSGVFSSSPVGEGGALIDGYWDNVTQTITFNLRGATDQISAGDKLDELFAVLQAAREFSKTTWTRYPAYVQFKAKDEVYYRYARIVNARIPQLRDQYSIEYAQLVMKDLDLTIEHPVSLGVPPGLGGPVLTGTRVSFNSANYGNYDGSGNPLDTNEVAYIASRHNLSNITQMHQGTGGANQFGGSLPRVIVTSLGTVYFGVDTAITDSGPFLSIVFHISRAAAGTTTGNWQLWNGSTWVTASAGSVFDGTLGFTQTGTQIVVIQAFSSTASPGGVLPTGYWIRYTSTGTYTTTPQIDREIYSVSRNYMEVPPNGGVNGSIAALLGLKAYNISNNDDLWRIMLGLRSNSRGDEFQSIINLGNTQNHSDITVQFQSGTGSFVASTAEWSTGYVGRSTFNGSYYTEIIIANPLSSHYTGEFRAFLVMGKSQTSTITAQLTYTGATGLGFETNEPYTIGSLASAGYANLPAVWDLGVMTMDPDKGGGGFEPNRIEIRIQITTNTTANLDRHCFILIPVDEYFMDAEPPTNYQGGYIGTSFFGGLANDLAYIGSLEFPREMHRTNFVITPSWDNRRTQTRFTPKAPGPMILQRKARQRLFGAYMYLAVGFTSAGTDEYLWRPSGILRVHPAINTRHLGLRGSQ